MAALSPLAVLDRGYAMVRAGEAIVRDASQVQDKERLHVTVPGHLGKFVYRRNQH